MDNFDDELKSHLAGSAASIVAEPAAVDDVEQRGHRRGRHRRVVAVVATVALVGAAAVGIRPLVTNDESTLDVAAGAPAATPDPGSGAANPAAAANNGEVSAPTTTFAPASLQRESTVGPRYGGEGGADWVVPWGDGFLSIDMVWTTIESPTLIPEFIAAFPPEIAAVIEASGVSTLQGMSKVLNAAGLAGQATELSMNDPELRAMFQSLNTSSATARLVVQQSADGSIWTNLDRFDPPVSADSIGRVMSDGTHLVIQSQSQIRDSATTLSVLVTTDFTNWQVFDITPPVVDSAPYVRNEQWLSDLAIGPAGWLASVQSSSYLDLLTPAPIETVVSVGTWDGWVRSSSRGAGSGYLEGQTVGTDAGFLTVRHGPETAGPVIEFSPDGIGWSAAEQLSGDWIGGLVAVEGGVLANVSGPDGTVMWRGNPDGTGWTEVDIAGIGDGLRRLYGQQITGPGFVSMIDVSKAVDTSKPDVEFDVGIEQDGQSIHLYAHDDGTADLIITDLATGEIVADITGAYSGIEAEFVQIGDDSLVIIDNDGNEVVSIPSQLILDTVLPARAAAIRASGWQPPPPQPPELMLVASADGLQWLVTPFEARGPAAQVETYPSAMAINGPTVAVRTGGWWQTFRIG